LPILRSQNDTDAICAIGEDVPGYQASVSIIHELSFGVVVLRTGRPYAKNRPYNQADVRSITQQAIGSVRTNFIRRREELLQQYTGRWTGRSSNAPNWEEDVVEVQFVGQSALIVTQLRIQGVDILQNATSLYPDARAQEPSFPWAFSTGAVLWSTGRDGEFRFVYFILFG